MEIYNGDNLILSVDVNDNSYRYRAIKGDHNLMLYFSLAEHVEIPVGATCTFQNEEYTLMSSENLTMHHTHNFEYTVIFESSQALLGRYKFRELFHVNNTWGGSRRLKFDYTAKPQEHLAMLVANLNKRDSGWSVGEYVEDVEKLIAYNHTSCLDALNQMADTFNTEWEIVGKTIHLRKVEYNRDNPLPLSYGKGNGFKPGIGRTNFDNQNPIEVLYTQGGERNIDFSKYGSNELLLPKGKTIQFDGVHFEDEEGFDDTKARTYKTDEDGYSIMRADKALSTHTEDSLDCSEIYPYRDETIIRVDLVDESKNWYDVVTNAPESLDYSQYGIGGETPTIIFQSGELAGREFELETDDEGNIICSKVNDDSNNFLGWKFQIVPSEQDGIIMPGGSFVPVVGDKFRVFGIQLPEAYIADDVTKSGAEWDMFRQGVKYFYDTTLQALTAIKPYSTQFT